MYSMLPLLFVAGAVAGGPTLVTYDAPTYDRWVYPFNSTPGTRIIASTFGTIGEPMFDDRDGQFLLTWDTMGDVPVAQGASAYVVTRCVVRIQNENDNVFTYDDTLDPYTAFLDPGDPDFVPDADPGQPIELFGAGFRSGFDAISFGETGPHGPAAERLRNAFALGFDAGAPIDVSNQVIDAFTPTPWAVGTIDTVAPGDPVPFGQTIEFDVNVDDPHVQAYLADGLDAGALSFIVSSLTVVFQGGGPFPSYFTKEHPFVQDGFAHAAQLELEYELVAACPLDLDGSGDVGFGDLVQILSAWGPCGAVCPEDLDASGDVGFGDLVQVLSAWGPC